MQKLVIDGGRPLSGEIKVQGAKNAVLPVLAACTLCSREVRLSNCPCISDRYGAARILTSLGGKVRADGTDMTVDCTGIDSSSISSELMRTMRSSIIFMGALMGRTGKCTLCYPGGGDLGPRPINMHLSAMKKMGGLYNRRARNYRMLRSRGSDRLQDIPFIPDRWEQRKIFCWRLSPQRAKLLSPTAQESLR